MKTKNCLILTILPVFAFCSGCSTLQDLAGLQKPSASLKGVKFADLSLSSATLVFDIDVSNPYSVPLPLTNLDYNLASKENNIFTGAAQIESSIPAKGSSTLSLPVKISYADVIKAFKYIRPGTEVPYNATVGLSVNMPVTGSLRLPLTKSGSLAVPDTQSLKNVDWQKLLEKATQ